MSTQITTAFVQQYRSNVFHLSQQKGSALAMAVRNESQKGKSSFYDRIGTVAAQVRTTRHGDTPLMDTPHSRRMVTMVDYEYADMIDNQDKIRMLIDPTSDYAQAAMWAMGRAKDQQIIAAALGTAYTGETGTGTQALGDAQRVAPLTSGNAHDNLNVRALRKASYLLNAGKVDKSIPRYCALNASMLESLLSQTETTSSDYAAVKALVQGEIDSFLGFKFIRTEELIAPTVAFSAASGTGLVGGDVSVTLATSKSAICWAGDGLLLSTGEDMVAEIGPRADKGYNTQVYVRMSIGATRMEESKVVEILCAQ